MQLILKDWRLTKFDENLYQKTDIDEGARWCQIVKIRPACVVAFLFKY